MRIDSVQADSMMEPLSSWLFRCTFSKNGSTHNSLLTETILKKLSQSVFSLNIPKLAENNQDDLSYGSFSVPFPYFSTGQKEMSIEFFETDDMLISRVFYIIQNKKRWKASTIFRMSDADIVVDVKIFSQRNVKGLQNPMDYPVFEREYGLLIKEINPPEFSRTGEVTLLKTKITFNTVESDIYDAEKAKYQSTGIDPNKEKYEWGNQKDDVAAIDMNDLGDKLAYYWGRRNSKLGDKPGLAGLFGDGDKENEFHYAYWDKKGKYHDLSVTLKDTYEYTEGKVFIVDGGNKNGSKWSNIPKITTLVMHTEAALHVDAGTAVKNTDMGWVGATADEFGQVMLNLDARGNQMIGIGSPYTDKNGNVGRQKSIGDSSQIGFGMEFIGDVAYLKDDKGRWFARRSVKVYTEVNGQKGYKGYDYKQLTDAEAKELVGEKYTEESIKYYLDDTETGQTYLSHAMDYELKRNHNVVLLNGNDVENVRFVEMYDSKLTDRDLKAAFAVGKAMRDSGKFNIDWSDMDVYSHGMAIEHHAGKSEMLPQRALQLAAAMKAGWEGRSLDANKIRAQIKTRKDLRDFGE